LTADSTTIYPVERLNQTPLAGWVDSKAPALLSKLTKLAVNKLLDLDDPAVSLQNHE
jgi:hypothetical protein